MVRRIWILSLLMLTLTGCSNAYSENTADYVTEGTERYRDFAVDSVLHSRESGDIHYCAFIPDTYDGSRAYSLYITLSGYQGLYFQGAAMNIRTEEFGFEAREYRDDMIILAPQLEDWGEWSEQGRYGYE